MLRKAFRQNLNSRRNQFGSTSPSSDLTKIKRCWQQIPDLDNKNPLLHLITWILQISSCHFHQHLPFYSSQHEKVGMLQYICSDNRTKLEYFCTVQQCVWLSLSVFYVLHLLVISLNPALNERKGECTTNVLHGIIWCPNEEEIPKIKGLLRDTSVVSKYKNKP